MRLRPGMRALAAICALCVTGAAGAHSFGRLYNLPVPFWLYAYGAAGALVISFLVAAYFLTSASAANPAPGRDVSDAPWMRALRRAHLVPVLQGLSVGGLVLCLLTGFFGTRNPYTNFNMTFFWVVFMLGFVYATALFGDLYAVINPWRVMADWVGRVNASFSRGRIAYPEAAGYWPALGFYMAFIWIELFGHIKPFSLAAMLLAYTVINLAGAWLVGAAAWFRHCEFLSVFLRLVGLMAPFAYARGSLRLRAPFSGLLREPAESMSLLLFVLFMLSSTAFDGLRSTVPWIRLFWQDPFNLITPWIGSQPVFLYPVMRPWYIAWETVALLLSPFVYLAVYLACIGLAKGLTRSALPVRTLALRFGLTLLPIALVYNITHYYTLLLTQGVKIICLVSDPFGWGWDLFGTAGKFRAPWLPDMGVVWHSQVALILLGHVVSVYLAHVEALRTFPTARQATLSQLPMLLLMLLFTTAGLWILAQPIQAGGN